MAELTYRAAVAAAIAQEMARDERVVVLGEDVAVNGGVFKLTEGLFERFGLARSRYSDQRAGDRRRRHGRGDDGTPADRRDHVLGFLRRLLGHRGQPDRQDALYDGRADCLPLVMHTANGGGLRFGAQHSQSVENWAMAIPGLKVVAPSTPADIWACMRGLRDTDPVVFCAHKALFAHKGDVPDSEHVDALGTARMRREGPDLTLVALAAMVPRRASCRAARAEDGL